MDGAILLISGGDVRDESCSSARSWIAAASVASVGRAAIAGTSRLTGETAQLGTFARFTTCFKVGEVLPRKLESPLKATVIWWVPTDRDDVE
jgi:hypothetical protein